MRQQLLAVRAADRELRVWNTLSLSPGTQIENYVSGTRSPVRSAGNTMPLVEQAAPATDIERTVTKSILVP
jgi:hypothetical protein